MCNIAGYAGNEQAAPLLLEMLRRQQAYDGGMSTGVATIHNGKLHYRKIVGDVDTLIRETDVLDLPGTIGIAHTRPAALKSDGPLHPFLSGDEKLALVLNGVGVPKHLPLIHETTEFLANQGYQFRHQWDNPKGLIPKLPQNGRKVHGSETRTHMMDHCIKNGETPARALAITGNRCYNDWVAVAIHENYPDEIFACRITRPMEAIVEKGACYIATSRFGFPENLTGTHFSLPLLHSCIITRDGVKVTGERVDYEPVSDMTPYTYAEGYRRIEELLRKGPVYFDELEFAADKMRDLWPESTSLVPHAKLIYDLLWQFESEGRLKRELRRQEQPEGFRMRWYFWLED